MSWWVGPTAALQACPGAVQRRARPEAMHLIRTAQISIA